MAALPNLCPCLPARTARCGTAGQAGEAAGASPTRVARGTDRRGWSVGHSHGRRERATRTASCLGTDSAGPVAGRKSARASLACIGKRVAVRAPASLGTDSRLRARRPVRDCLRSERAGSVRFAGDPRATPARARRADRAQRAIVRPAIERSCDRAIVRSRWRRASRAGRWPIPSAPTRARLRLTARVSFGRPLACKRSDPRRGFTGAAIRPSRP